MAEKGNGGTPLLDELEKGPWPSFVKQIKSVADKEPAAKDLLQLLERSYREKIGDWKHGGIGGVKGYGGGGIGESGTLQALGEDAVPLIEASDCTIVQSGHHFSSI